MMLMLSPFLPIELTDMIIDWVNTIDWHSPSSTRKSLALTSRPFRRRVNRHRFEMISLRYTSDIQSTYDLLENDCVWKNEHERLTAHVKDFDVWIMISPKPLLATDSANLEFILRNVFRKYPRGRTPNASLYFSWDVMVWDRLSHKGCAFDWTDMSTGVRSAFRAILENPCLAHLELYALKNIPQDLIRACPIKELHLTEVSFANAPLTARHEGIMSAWQLQHIAKFVTDHSTPLLEYMGTDAYNAESPSTTIFPRLESLECCICNKEEYEMTAVLMQHAKNVKYFSLAFLKPRKLPKLLSFARFENLETLSLTCYGALRPLAPDYEENVRNIITPFLPALPPMRHLEIKLAIFSTNRYMLDLEMVFDDHDFSPIDDFLARSWPGSLESIEVQLKVVITYDYDSPDYASLRELQDGCSEYVRETLFPKMAKKPLNEFRVVAKVDEYFHISREHYSSDPCYKWSFIEGIDLRSI